MVEETITIKNGKKLKLWSSIIASIVCGIVLATIAWLSVLQDIAQGEYEREIICNDIKDLDSEGTHVSRQLRTDVEVLKNSIAGIKITVRDNNSKLDTLLLRSK